MFFHFWKQPEEMERHHEWELHDFLFQFWAQPEEEQLCLWVPLVLLAGEQWSEEELLHYRAEAWLVMSLEEEGWCLLPLEEAWSVPSVEEVGCYLHVATLLAVTLVK